jgi:hypothetical protein
MATYTNIATNEVYKLSGVKSLEHAFDLYKFVCKRNNWNECMFAQDVIVKFN